MNRFFTLIASTLIAGAAHADPAVIEAVTAKQTGTGWTFSVTVRHPDTGWEHYADGWDIQTVDGTQIGYRELLHPHEQEQPFTRSLGNVVVPDGVDTVLIRAHCSVDGWVGEPFAFKIER